MGPPTPSRSPGHWSRRSRSTTRLVQRAETHDTQILACPFAYAGRAEVVRWSVEGDLHWRGLVLPFKRVSALLCASVPGWRVFPYELEHDLPSERPQLLDETGRPDAHLAWEYITQEDRHDLNLAEPFRVDLSQRFAPRYPDDRELGCYAWARVISPDAREAVIRLQRWSDGEGHRLFVNGQAVSEVAELQEDPTSFDPLHSYTTQPVSLHAGANDLVLETRGHVRQWWFFSAQFTTPGGDLITDLTYDAPD